MSKCPRILLWHIQLYTQCLCRVNRPVWIPKQAAPDGDEISITAGDDGLGQGVLVEHTHGNNGHVKRLLDLACKRYLIARIVTRFALARPTLAARADMHDVDPSLTISTAQLDSVIDPVTAIDVFDCRDANQKRHIAWHFAFHCLDDFDAKAGEVLSVFIRTAIGHRRLELMNEITVCAV